MLAIPVNADDVAELQHVRETVAGMFTEIDEEDIFPSDVDGWYTIRKGSIIAYISGDGRYLLQGDLIDLAEQVNLSEKDRNADRIKVIGTAVDDEAIVFTPKTVRHRVSVFTDIDCGYCRQLHGEMDQVNALGIAVQYVSYPRTGPDTDSWDKADRVWCAPERNTAFTEATLAGKLPEESCDATPVAGHYDFGHLVGVRGTPTVLTNEGVHLGGYLAPQDLFAQLEALAA